MIDLSFIDHIFLYPVNRPLGKMFKAFFVVIWKFATKFLNVF